MIDEKHSEKVIYQKKVTVEWGDLDALGHVNNGRYFDYFQEARVQWLKTMEMDLREPHGPVLIQTGCTFLRPVFYPATLDLICKAHSLGRTSFIIDYDLLQDGEIMAKGTSKIVWIDYVKNKSIPLPDAFRSLLEA